jgi:hypothetical protein
MYRRDVKRRKDGGAYNLDRGANITIPSHLLRSKLYHTHIRTHAHTHVRARTHTITNTHTNTYTDRETHRHTHYVRHTQTHARLWIRGVA